MHATGLQVVAADHPSLDRDVELFVEALRSEPRYFGPTARNDPKPFPSLITALAARDGLRMAVIECGRIVGLARVGGDGQVYLAVAADRRGTGIGVLLGRAVLERAIALRYRRLVIRSDRRSRSTRRIGEALGCSVIEGEHGRTDLLLDLHRRAPSAWARSA